MARKARRGNRIGADDERPLDGSAYAQMTVALLACLVRRVEDSADQIQFMDAFGMSSKTIGK